MRCGSSFIDIQATQPLERRFRQESSGPQEQELKLGLCFSYMATVQRWNSRICWGTNSAVSVFSAAFRLVHRASTRELEIQPRVTLYSM